MVENRLGRFGIEKLQPYRSSRRSAPGAQGYTSEGRENPSEEEDPRRRHGATRKYCDGRHTRYRDEKRYGNYERYRNAEGGGYPSDEDDTEPDESRRSDHSVYCNKGLHKGVMRKETKLEGVYCSPGLGDTRLDICTVLILFN